MPNLFLNAARNLEPLQLQRFEFVQNDVLFDVGLPATRVYFPFDAVLSLVVTLEGGAMVEAAMAGRDSVVGGLSALDGKESVGKTIVQLSGRGMSCSAAAFKAAVMQNSQLHSMLMKHEQVLFAQAQQSSACNASHSLDARFARWMLRASDLTGGNDLTFTQEFVSEMLGVGRTSVSITAHQLQNAGLIKYARGKVHISNRDGLKDVACECYNTVKSHYDRLWGRSHSAYSVKDSA